MTPRSARWLLALALTGAAFAPAPATCAAPAKARMRTACCCPHAATACRMARPGEQGSALLTLAVPASSVPVLLAAVPPRPQPILVAVRPASAPDASAPAAIPKRYLRTHNLRL